MKLKRLTIEMLEKDHKKLKMRALEVNVPLRQYVTDAIAIFMELEKKNPRYRE